MPQANFYNNTPMPAVSTRRRFLSQAAGVAAGGAVVALATVSAAADAAAPMAALAASGVDSIFALIAGHRAEQQSYSDALMARDELKEIVPEEIGRRPRVQFGMKAGEPYYLHSHQQIDRQLVWMPDFGSTPKIRARLHAGLSRDMCELAAKQDEYGLPAAEDRVEQLCDSCQELAWALANTMPTSMAGVAAVLHYANEIEDRGEEWPDTDTVGSDGWHYQLRQSAARALGNLAVTS
jgi:hypothetical protein